MKRAALLATVIIVLIPVLSTSKAAVPRKQGHYVAYVGDGKETITNQLSLTVTNTGKTVFVNGPAHSCGDYLPQAHTGHLKISRKGAFRGKRSYADTLQHADAAKPSRFTWTVEVSGRFVSSTKARGKFAYTLRQTAPVQQDCGKQRGKFSAKFEKPDVQAESHGEF